MTIKAIKELIHGDETRSLELKKSTGELKDAMRTAYAYLYMPQFTVGTTCFRVTFLRPDYSYSVQGVNDRGVQEVYDGGVQGVNDRGEQGVNDRGEQGVNDLTDMEKKIIAAISLKPDISLAGIAQQLNLSRKNTHKHMASMQKRGIITRFGPSFGGIWKVILSPKEQTTNNCT